MRTGKVHFLRGSLSLSLSSPPSLVPSLSWLQISSGRKKNTNHIWNLSCRNSQENLFTSYFKENWHRRPSLIFAQWRSLLFLNQLKLVWGANERLFFVLIYICLLWSPVSSCSYSLAPGPTQSTNRFHHFQTLRRILLSCP